MLIRKQNGCIFHIVCGETRTVFICLCGARVIKNCVSKQLLPDGVYVRCSKCSRLEKARLSKCPNLKVY